MRATHTLLVIIIKINYYRFGNSQLEENDNCFLDSGRMGVCVPLEKCPEVIRHIRNGARPKPCGFNGIHPTVCCETISFRSSTEQGVIARQKCEEYAITSIPTTTTTTTTTTTPPPPGSPKYDIHYAIAGVDAFPLEFPHMAILGYGSSEDIKWQCGGSLISENFVLTAAHCISTRLGDVQHVKLGVHTLDFVRSYEETFKIKKVYRHPKYVRTQDYHDIGLIELDRPANIQSGVKPACLHTGRQMPTELLVATGWGAVELYGGIHNVLQKVNLSHVPTEKCTRYYNGLRGLRNGLIGDSQICADGAGTRADTCQGDSGGPLQTKLLGDSLYTIVGVTSFGLKCSEVPGVYTRVSHYVPWIENIVWPEEPKSKNDRSVSYYNFGSD